MFQADQVKSLNELETLAFNYIVKNSQAKDMTIRELAQKVYVSTSTIIRMANKLGFDGWAELKFYLKSEFNRAVEEQHYDNMMEFNLFLHRMSQPTYQHRLNETARLISETRYCVFMGVGQSGAIAAYGARYFTSIGLKAFAISDPYIAIQVYGEDVVGIVLSESGETEQVVNKTIELKGAGSKVISVTNNEENSIARLADIRLSYNLVDEWSKLYPLGNLTTGLPSLAIVETLAHKAVSRQFDKVVKE